MPASPVWRTSPPPQPEQLWFLIPPGVHLLDLAGPAQILTHAELGGLEPHYIGLSEIGRSEQLRSAQGLLFSQLEPLPDALPPHSWLLVIGGHRSAELLQGDSGRKLANWPARRT